MARVTLLLAVCLTARAAFVPSLGSMRREPVCARATEVSMVTAKEVFGQYYERSTPVQKSLQTVPPAVAKGGMASVVAAAAATGFVLTPSRRLAVNIAGGAISGGMGVIARKRLAEERQKAALPAVAALLSEGLQKANPDSLASIASEFGVAKKTFQTQLGELYLSYLNACLISSKVETAELSELIRLKELLSLSSQQVGAQVLPPSPATVATPPVTLAATAGVAPPDLRAAFSAPAPATRCAPAPV